MTPESIKADTEYVVLGVYENDWTVAGVVAARDGAAAIKDVLAKGDLPERIAHTNCFVAVPRRSWQPVEVTKKVETTFVLTDVKKPVAS